MIRARANPAVSLLPRKAPTQRRAVETHGRILDAAAQLLDEAGLDALTTNAVAVRANTNVATLYSYFPNKYAILTALARRLAEQQDAIVAQALAQRGRRGDWRKGVDAIIDVLVAGIRGQAGAIAIRRAMQAQPDLREVDREANLKLEKLLARELRRLGLGASAARARVIARCLVESATALVDAAVSESGTKSARLIEEWKLMHRSYLAHYFEGARSRDRSPG